MCLGREIGAGLTPLRTLVIGTLAGFAWRLTRDPACSRHRTRSLDRCGDSLCHHQPAFRVRELKLLLPIYDRARFQQDRWHVRSVKHDKVIVTINAGFRIDQFKALTPISGSV